MQMMPLTPRQSLKGKEEPGGETDVQVTLYCSVPGMATDPEAGVSPPTYSTSVEPFPPPGQAWCALASEEKVRQRALLNNARSRVSTPEPLGQDSGPEDARENERKKM